MQYPYEIVKQRLMEPQDEGKLSDKEAGIRLGVSERKVRQWRLEGMDEWEADRVCVRRFGLLPFLVFGWDEWFGPVLAALDEAV